MSVGAIVEASHRGHDFTLKPKVKVVSGEQSPNLQFQAPNNQVHAQTREVVGKAITIVDLDFHPAVLQQTQDLGTGESSFVKSTMDGKRVTTNGAGSGRVQQVTAETPVTTPLFRRVAALNNAHSAQQANEAAKNPGNRVNGM